MNIIELFLSALTHKIQVLSSVLNDLSSDRNNVLELENILLSSQINKNDIQGRALLNLNEATFNRVIELLTGSPSPTDADLFETYRDVINLCQEIVDNHGNVENMEQYQNALNWFNYIASLIKEYIKGYTAESINELMPTGDTLKILNRYLNKFDLNQLVIPIFDMDKFNHVINLCGLTYNQQAQIKKVIGQTNINLVLNYSRQKADELAQLDKFRDILKSSSSNEKLMTQMLEIISANYQSLIIADAKKYLQLIIKKQPQLALADVKESLKLILLTNELVKTDDFLNSDYGLDERHSFMIETLHNCERILVLLDKTLTGEPILTTSDKIKLPESATKLIKEVEEIIKKEEFFLQSINPDDYNRQADLLALADVKPEDKLAIILGALKQELPAFKVTADRYAVNHHAHQNSYDGQFQAISDYLETYHVLRTRINPPAVETKTLNYQILYLANSLNQSLIEAYLMDLTDNYKKQLKALIKDLNTGQLKNAKPISEAYGHSILSIERKDVKLSYMAVTNEILMILFASTKSKGYLDQLNQCLIKYMNEINNLIKRTQRPEDLALLINEQAEIRSSINEIFSSLTKRNSKAKAA